MKQTLYLLTFTSILILSSCNKPEPVVERLPTEVSVYHLTKEQVTDAKKIQQYAGVASPHDYVDVVPQLSGTIINLGVKDGQYVQKGQFLARIDNEDYRNQSAVQQAQLKFAKETYLRMKEVYEKGSIAEIKFLEAKSNYEQAQAAVKASQFYVSKSNIHAPKSGYIANLTAVQGSLAGEGQFLMRIIDIQQLDILVSIAANEIHLFKNGLSANVFFPTLEDKMVTGRVADVSMFSPTGTPSYTVKVKIENSGQQIRPGMNARVEFDAPTQEVMDEAKLFIPAEAVQIDNKNQHFIYVVDSKNGKALKRLVTLGQTTGDFIEIEKGLDATATIITSGFQKITDQSKITVKK